MVPCTGGMLDPATNLCWQDPPYTSQLYNWYQAASLCAYQPIGGVSGWHLPTLDESRTLFRKCPNLESGGACLVTNAHNITAWYTDDCALCGNEDWDAGFGDAGLEPSPCFYPPELHPTNCGDLPVGVDYWTATFSKSDHSEAWVASFASGRIKSVPVGSFAHYARCVRNGP